ncbi:MAG: hypothetical protein QM796_08725 [Chthoniobacteraceae bacterium]
MPIGNAWIHFWPGLVPQGVLREFRICRRRLRNQRGTFSEEEHGEEKFKNGAQDFNFWEGNWGKNRHGIPGRINVFHGSLKQNRCGWIDPQRLATSISKSISSAWTQGQNQLPHHRSDLIIQREAHRFMVKPRRSQIFQRAGNIAALHDGDGPIHIAHLARKFNLGSDVNDHGK